MAIVPAATALLLVLSVISLNAARSDKSIFIQPMDSSDCGNHSPCNTLSNFIAHNSTVLNTSNTTIQFLTGVHQVNLTNITQLCIKGIRNIRWYGRSSKDTKIVCDTPLALVFSDIEALDIRDLTFSGCGHRKAMNCSEYPAQVTARAAITLVNVSNFHLKRIEICQSKGYGLLGINIWGDNNIASSNFSENNHMANCSTEAQYDVNCVGGNAAFYFYNTVEQMEREEVFLTINTSKYLNGGPDMPFGSASFSCNDLHNMSMTTDPKFEANGLLLVTAQHNYRVNVHVVNSEFTGNTGNYLNPGVWVHDYSGITNNRFSFQNCNFNKEGPVRISLTDNQNCESNVCYAKDKANRKIQISFVTLQNCKFSRGPIAGVEICVKPTYVRYGKFQKLVIANSTFLNYRRPTNTSIVKIEYIISSSEKYPSIAIEIANSTFNDNSIPVIQCHFSNTYSEPKGKPQKTKIKHEHLLTLRDSIFEHNANDDSTVWIYTQKEKALSIWEYETTINKDNKSVIVVEISRCTFRENTSNKRFGTIRIDYTYISLDNSIFDSCIGTPLHVFKSVVRIQGNNTFVKNSGTLGGALNLDKSRIFIRSDSHTEITNNIAEYGGGIFAIAEMISWEKMFEITGKRGIYNRCTFSPSTGKIGAISLFSNRAKRAGNSIFGGTYSTCRFNCNVNSCRSTTEQYTNAFPKYIEVNKSEVASPPSKLCICEGEFVNRNNCTNQTTLTVFPGQTLTVPLIAMGELNGSLTAVVSGTICKDYNYEDKKCTDDYKNDIGYGQRMQELTQTCTNVTYTINSDSKAFIEVKIDYDSTQDIKFNGIDLIDTAHFQKYASKGIIMVNLSKCPIGFEIKDTKYRKGQRASCMCLKHFRSHRITCNIENGTVNKPQNKWIYASDATKHSYFPALLALVNKTSVVHKQCPFDYCISEYTAIDLSMPEKQCNYNRSGILCGACQANLSLVFGTSNCKECSDMYLLLVIPFALAGVALVVLLLKCNLTVSIGHINGIIFYANIVQVNKPLLFPNQGTPYKIFSAFIAWLNLDLGIETCFFQNMDSYAKVWLQFVFPVYLWIIIGLIIVAAKHSSRVGRLTGKNSVPVLATLFLFSYAKLLRAIIATVYFTYIDFEDESYSTVWKVDGNVKYFSPKHTVLFLVALMFGLCYILPLTLLVLFAPCLQAKSHLKAFKWVNRLKPFLDAYQGPYSDKFRYWTGLMLVFRILLLFAFATNFENDPSMNFFWTIVGIGPVAAFVIATRKVYRQKLANYIEALSLLNVVLLCSVNWLTTTTVYMKWHPIREYSTYISICITLASFGFIILYQLVRIVCSARIIKKKKEDRGIREFQLDAPRENNPTSTVVELEQSDVLQEPLLDKY